MRSAAVLLAFLESETPGISNEIFAKMGEGRAKKLIKEISTIGKIDKYEIEEVVNEFYSLAIEQKAIFGGKDLSNRILKEAFGVMNEEDFFTENSGLFNFLDSVSLKDIMAVLDNETTQYAAMLLTYMPEHRIAGVMDRMSQEDTENLSEMMLKINVPNLPFIWKLHHQLKSRLLGDSDHNLSEHQEKLIRLAGALEIMPTEKRDKLLARLESTEGTSIEELKSYIFTFNDFINVSDRDLQTMLYEMPSLATLACALQSKDTAFVSRFYDNMLERSKMILEEEMDRFSSADEEEIEAAEKEIISYAREMEREGKVKSLSQQKLEAM